MKRTITHCDLCGREMPPHPDSLNTTEHLPVNFEGKIVRLDITFPLHPMHRGVHRPDVCQACKYRMLAMLPEGMTDL